MIISVIGNIGCGKSTFLEEIKKSEKFKNDDYISIDECRLRAAEFDQNNNSWEIEDRAWEIFLEQIYNSQNKRLFIESSGLSKKLLNAYSIIKKENQFLYIVKIYCSKETSKNRVLTRKKQIIPFPYNEEELEAIDYMAKEIKKLTCNLTLNSDKLSSMELVYEFQEKFLRETP